MNASAITRLFAAATLVLLPAYASAAPPTLDSLFPAGGQRGKTVEVAAAGTFERWPVSIWVNGKGVDEATGARRRFKSSIIPPWCRKSPKVAEVPPLMYLHGMSAGAKSPALSEFFSSSAGPSPSKMSPI